MANAERRERLVKWYEAQARYHSMMALTFTMFAKLVGTQYELTQELVDKLVPQPELPKNRTKERA